MNQTGSRERKVVLPGGAGLVGQNLVPRLKAKGYTNIVVLDKHRHNLSVLQQMHPDITAEWADLAAPGPWSKHFEGVDTVVMLQAQIGAKERETYVRNTVTSTRYVLDATKKYQVPYIVHISSSVLASKAEDYYTQTKKEQEDMVLASGVNNVVLRPTLMFGWFDRKHLGWLSRFMQRVPVFPIPSDGKYLRQPLYVGDFCDIIVRCIEERRVGGVYPVTGMEKIDYIEIVRAIREAIGAHTRIVYLPYWLFVMLLRIWAVFDPDPPFTVSQLKALVTPDVFEDIDWPGLFNVKPTPFATAIRETFLDPRYGKIELEF
ncbi:NAD-dependent epimerase/dehydratase [mine drainage metagenome]|uniref:NAD-dependent epimerase/dehydratase n=1 Tax=mine drainage metagenome TaxID=410659 RepID=T1BMW7_9ZZZZ